jgi:hypothetical protein
MPSEKSKKKRDRDETAEERAARKAAKKAEKVAKMLGYSNDTNPFGDSNLLQPFVWGKKVEKEKKEGKAHREGEGSSRLGMLEEINRVRKRREDREAELEEMDRLRAEEQRLREAAQYGDWQRKEEDFHTEQTRVRSKIRLVENREKPIDVLAKNILLIESVNGGNSKNQLDASTVDLSSLDAEIRDPIHIMNVLHPDQFDDLIVDIESYCQLSRKDANEYERFWTSMKTYAQYLNKQIIRSDRGDKSSIHSSLRRDVAHLLDGKNDKELTNLLHDIRTDIEKGKYSDITYWEEVAVEIEAELAKIFIKSVHQTLLQKQLEVLGHMRKKMEKERMPTSESTIGGNRGDDRLQSSDMNTAEQDLMAAEQRKGLGDNEEKMQEEVGLPDETYWWQDRYRPRKPRYFNRVRTGWDWNKYNQTHYDHDNPPPKTIQGYKFAVFYPDLIDKDTTPKYFLEASDESEFAILRFHAGPPYEDIAFKILNKEWDINRKSGFRCLFERGLLQLQFNFKRQWYRR